MPKPVKRAWKCWWTWDPTNLTHLYPFTKNPEWLLGIFHTPNLTTLSLRHTQVPFYLPLLGWDTLGTCSQSEHQTRSGKVLSILQILYFNTEVSLYKLLTRHRELSGCGPKLKRQLLAPLASEEKSVKPFPGVSHFLVGKVFPCIRYGHI